LQAWLHKTGVRVKVERTLESLKSSIDMSTNTAMKVLMVADSKQPTCFDGKHAQCVQPVPCRCSS
jgi:hypothetical protein